MGITAALNLPQAEVTHVEIMRAIAQDFKDLPMVLKGGTSLRLVHYENYRYSADLDYSLLGISTALQAAVLPTKLGDLDADGQPTVLDLVRLIGQLNGSNPLSASLLPYGDINEDGLIDLQDLAKLEDAILGSFQLPNPLSAPARAYNDAARRLMGDNLAINVPLERFNLLGRIFGGRAA